MTPLNCFIQYSQMLAIGRMSTPWKCYLATCQQFMWDEFSGTWLESFYYVGPAQGCRRLGLCCKHTRSDLLFMTLARTVGLGILTSLKQNLWMFESELVSVLKLCQISCSFCKYKWCFTSSLQFLLSQWCSVVAKSILVPTHSKPSSLEFKASVPRPGIAKMKLQCAYES